MRHVLPAFVLLFALPALAQSPAPRYGAVFDQFEYGSAPSAGTASSGTRSLFGPNVWITQNGTQTARAWRRYNWNDLPTIGSYQTGLPSQVRMLVPQNEPAGRPPGISSSFVLGDGTYMARVNFSAVPSGTFNAFWLQSQGTVEFADQVGNTAPQQWGSEVDFELRQGGMTIANIRGYPFNSTNSTQNLTLDCGAWDGSANYAMEDCRNGLGQRVNGSGTKYLEFTGRWVNLVLVVERGVRVAFYAYSDGANYSLWGGEESAVQQNFPQPDHPEFATAFAPVNKLGPIFSIDGLPSSLTQDVSLAIDYFYYTPASFMRTDGTLDVATLQDEVQRVEATYRPAANASGLGLRVNTLGANLDLGRTPGQTPAAPSISGPSALTNGVAYTWTLLPEHNGGRQKAITWTYSLYSTGSSPGWGPATPINKDQLTLTKKSTWSLIRLVARTQSVDYVTGQLVGSPSPTTTFTSSLALTAGGAKAVSVDPIALRLGAPRPNPAAGSVTIDLAVPQAGPAHLSVFDLLGREVAVAFSGSLAPGTHSYSVDVSDLPAGVYAVRLRAGETVLTQRLTVTR